MVAREFINSIERFRFVESSSVHDFADRCSYILSFIILSICFSVVAVKSYVLTPITCYIPTTFSGNGMAHFVNIFCWINGTVSTHIDKNQLENETYFRNLEDHHRLQYYQWVVLVLALQAILCYVPGLFWEGLTYNRLGTNLSYIIETAQTAARDTGSQRTQKVALIASGIETLLHQRRELKYGPKRNVFYRFVAKIREYLPSKRMGRAISFYYFITKIIYVVIAISQIFIMQKFLHMEGPLFGPQILKNLWEGRHWNETLIFPRVGYCRVPFKLLGFTIPTAIAQCTLSNNMLNEKIFIFLWFWFAFVAVLQVISIGTWIFRVCVRKNRVESLIYSLRIVNAYKEELNDIIEKFESEYLRPDGIFLLQMLRLNAGAIISNEILNEMIQRFYDKQVLMSFTRNQAANLAAARANQNPYGIAEDVADENGNSVIKRFV